MSDLLGQKLCVDLIGSYPHSFQFGLPYRYFLLMIVVQFGKIYVCESQTECSPGGLVFGGIHRSAQRHVFPVFLNIQGEQILTHNLNIGFSLQPCVRCTFCFFQLIGKIPVSILRLHTLVIESIIAGADNFRILILKPSRPVAFELDID